MKGNVLKILRVVVSATLFAVVTASLAGTATIFPGFAAWIAGVQIVPAILDFSLFTFVVWLLATLIFGRIYCSSVCPLGTLQDAFSRLRRLTPGAERRHPYRFKRPLYKLQYVVLIITLLALMTGLTAVTGLLDPYTVYADIIKKDFLPLAHLTVTGKIVVGSVAGSLVALVLLIIVGVVSARSGRTLCNSICPVGTTLGFVSRFAVFQIDIDTDKCTHCGCCEAACKASCINLRENTVDGTRCVNCFDCLTVCPNDAIHYTSDRKQLSDTLMQRIVKPQNPATSLDSGTPDFINSKNEQSTDETIS